MKEGEEPAGAVGSSRNAGAKGWNWPHGLKRVWGVNRYGAGDTGPEVLQRVARGESRRRRTSFIDSAARFGVDALLPAVNRPFIPRGLHFYAAGPCH